MTLEERIARYLDKCAPAISGSDGHGQTFTVACALVNGFALDAEAALRHLTTYNAKCSPPWSARELRHKIIQAEKTTHEKPRGHLLGVNGNSHRPANQSPTTTVPAVPVRLTPRKRRFGTVGTLIRNPYGYAREKELPHAYRSVGAFTSSQASQDAVKAFPATGGTSIGFHIDPAPDLTGEMVPLVAVPGCKVGRPEEIQMADEEWRKLDASGFASEPMVQFALQMFGPGCHVLDLHPRGDREAFALQMFGPGCHVLDGSEEMAS